jgi:23S rRNA G2445 N2-methylase RlmL
VTGAGKAKPFPTAQPLAQRVLDPGFTPRVADIGSILGLLADDTLASAAERAIARVRSSALPALLGELATAVPPVRGRIVRVIGRIAARDDAAVAIDALVRALDDRDPKTRRNAAIALGHVRGERVEAMLLRAWSHDERPEMRRSLAASLGKVGGPRALDVLRDASGAEDRELARIADRSIMMIERTASRPSPGQTPQIASSRSAPRPIDVIALCRRGLEEILAEELRGISAVTDVLVEIPGQVRARLRGSLQALFAARTMLGFQFPLPPQRLDDHERIEQVLAQAVASDSARQIFETWGTGAPRYRIDWAEGGHRRAATWQAAQAIARTAPGLVNDPTQSGWQILVARRSPFLDVAIAPRDIDDPRFSWRRRDVPAASHPTIAAGLARVAGPRDDDVVWDPFVGSGAELIERASLGPCRSLLGSDVDERALAAALENCTAAGVEATLQKAEALTLRPRGVTLVLTNPPMGRRASRARGLAEFLDRFVAHAAEVLRPGGRLVWIAPHPRRARKAGLSAGMHLHWARIVDMGGFEGEMQRWERPA